MLTQLYILINIHKKKQKQKQKEKEKERDSPNFALLLTFWHWNYSNHQILPNRFSPNGNDQNQVAKLTILLTTLLFIHKLLHTSIKCRSITNLPPNHSSLKQHYNHFNLNLIKFFSAPKPISKGTPRTKHYNIYGFLFKLSCGPFVYSQSPPQSFPHNNKLNFLFITISKLRSVPS